MSEDRARDKKAKSEYDAIREEFLEWLLLDDNSKRVYQLPRNQTEFADVKGVETRTLRRWQNGEDFQKRLEQRRQKQNWSRYRGTVTPASRPQKDPRAEAKFDPGEPATAEQAEAAVLAEVDASASDSPDERDYLLLKQTLRDQAAEGDARSLDLYMKYWGSEFAKREQARRESSFAEMTDRDLAWQTLDLLGESTVREWLDQHG